MASTSNSAVTAVAVRSRPTTSASMDVRDTAVHQSNSQVAGHRYGAEAGAQVGGRWGWKEKQDMVVIECEVKGACVREGTRVRAIELLRQFIFASCYC